MEVNYCDYAPIFLALCVIIFAVALVTEFMRGCTAGTACKVLDVRHMVLLLFNALVAFLYIVLEVRWNQVVLHAPDHNLDEMGWRVLETLYFVVSLYWMKAFRERYDCPRRPNQKSPPPML